MWWLENLGGNYHYNSSESGGDHKVWERNFNKYLGCILVGKKTPLD